MSGERRTMNGERRVLSLSSNRGRFDRMDQRTMLSEKSWVEIWRQAGKELEVIRRREIECADTRMAILSLGDAFESAVLHRPLAVNSGMSEMQRLFGRVSDGAVDQDRS